MIFWDHTEHVSRTFVQGVGYPGRKLARKSGGWSSLPGGKQGSWTAQKTWGPMRWACCPVTHHDASWHARGRRKDSLSAWFLPKNVEEPACSPWKHHFNWTRMLWWETVLENVQPDVLIGTRNLVSGNSTTRAVPGEDKPGAKGAHRTGRAVSSPTECHPIGSEQSQVGASDRIHRQYQTNWGNLSLELIHGAQARPESAQSYL